jgi:hypothetical protein
MSVSEAQSKIDSAEFAEWCAYSNIVPFYQDRSEYLLAVIAATLINVNRKKNSKAVKAEDFLHIYQTRKPRDTADEMYIKLRAMFNGNNK